MFRTALLLSLLALPAFATAQFPATIENKYGLPGPQPQSCGLCHTNGITGNGTVNTPIGRALRMRGLVANDEASLIAALDALAADMVDSDGDGVTDVAELMAGTNPNVADAPGDGGTGGGTGGGGGATVLPPPRYGCGAAVVPQLLLAAALFPLLRRRWRAPRG